jgi:DNA invertase Pin-like site-specific DNA recombinase
MNNSSDNSRSRYTRYTRTSSAAQSSEGHDRQLVAIKRHLDQTPGLQRMQADVEIGLIQVDRLVIQSRSRLGRSENLVRSVEGLFKKSGVRIIAAD